MSFAITFPSLYGPASTQNPDFSQEYADHIFSPPCLQEAMIQSRPAYKGCLRSCSLADYLLFRSLGLLECFFTAFEGCSTVNFFVERIVLIKLIDLAMKRKQFAGELRKLF